MTPAIAEPASFRDPDTGIFYASGGVYRGLSERAQPEWERLQATSFFDRLIKEGKIVDTEVVDEAVMAADVQGGAPASPRGSPWALVLRHERVPVVSFPFEWPFAMLREAAMLHLDVLLAALDETMSMKDGTAYNVQFFGSRPVFVDIGSFEPSQGPWPGYRQFCQTMLFPLMIQAYLGVPFQPLLRGSVDGLSPTDVSGMFSGLARFRRGVLRNVTVHSVLERRVTASSQDVRRKLTKAGYNVELAKAAARNLRKLVDRLEVGGRGSMWSEYRDTCSYSDADVQAKERFVGDALAAIDPGTVVDLGANDGTYSLLAADHAGYVVAADSDEAVIDGLYRRLRSERREDVLPLVLDVTDPSPALGWRNRERAPFAQRVHPDAVLALALVHHLAIGANVPLSEVVDWLVSLGGRLIVEFVDRDDPMVKRLLANKPPGLFDDYQRSSFESALQKQCRVERIETLSGGTRTLYLATPG
jgi:SAM-dependent methyltransferase